MAVPDPPASPQRSSSANTVVRTAYGDVRVISDSAADRDGQAREVLIAKGIPFATAKRFQSPSMHPVGPGVFDATQYGPICPQRPGALERLLGGSSLPMDEDCLHLNVFTPGADDARRPVLVWIHGGAFVTGSGAMPWYHGAALAARGDVVVVTVNYRLGALGFTGLGNHGLEDQLLALDWVRGTIEAFGGDPERITVFGESAGGASVLALMAADSDRARFRGAWAMSPSIPQLRDSVTAEAHETRLLDAAGVSTRDALRELPLEILLEAQGQLLADPAHALTAFAPTVDGHLLCEPVTETVARDPRPLVIGTCRDEMHLFTAFDPRLAALDEAGALRRFERRFGDHARDALGRYRHARPDASAAQLVSAMQTDEMFRVPADDLAAERTHPTWSTWFTFPSHAFDGLLGACHGLDIPYTFANLHRPGVTMFTGDHPDREAVADVASDALIRFAQTGDPGWEPHGHTRATWQIDAPGQVIHDPEPELRAMWRHSGQTATP